MPPVWMRHQIDRPALVERLDEALRRRLTIVHAPAGYGKTSLLSQWRHRLDSTNVAAIWLTLEGDDAEPARFAQYLAFSLDPSEAAAPSLIDLPPRAALSALIARLAREPRAVVVILDDFHRIESAALTDFVRALIRLAPDNCHLVLASRDYPWLGQSALALEEQLLELSGADLRFSPLEAAALLDRGQPRPLPPGELDQIVERTEGWPIALQLTALSLKRGIDTGLLLERLGHATPELARYLSEQVLTTLPPDTQDVVARTALLDHIDGDTVNYLCERDDGWAVIERLEQHGVDLTPVSPDRRAWRYHQLFAEYLRDRLRHHDRARYRSLQERAARWFAASGAVAEAVNHALLADDPDLVATILEDAGGWRLIPHGAQAVVARALAALPAALVKERPRLLLAHVYLSIKVGQFGTARASFDRFVATHPLEQLAPDLRLEVRVVGDTLTEYENQPMSLDDLLARETLIRTLPGDDHLVIANVSESLAAKYYEGGWLERAIEPTLIARAHYQAMGSLYSDLFTRFLEGRIRWAQGRLRDAEAILHSAGLTIDEAFGMRSDLAANNAAFAAELLYDQDRTDEAEALLDWALPHMEQSDGWVDVYAAAYFTAARIAAARGDMGQALSILSGARRVSTQRGLRQLALLARLCELELYLHRDGDIGHAIELAASLDLDALADEMAEVSPPFRPVAVAAARCRIRLALLQGDSAGALVQVEALGHWGRQHGAGRLLIETNMLLAEALRHSGEIGRARAVFDEAIDGAMFQDVRRPFIDAHRFVQPMLEEALAAPPSRDRFRNRFLRDLARSVAAAARPEVIDDALLNGAEVEILEHLRFGYSNKEIARLIGMSPDTVKYRLKSVFRKIGVNSRQDAVRVALERALLTRQESAADH